MISLAIALPAASAWAGEVRIVRTANDQLRIVATEATAAQLADALGPHLDRPISIDVPSPVTVDYVGGEGRDLAWAVARRSGRILARSASSWRIQRGADATVTLDAWSQGSREVLREMALQCGVRNLALDPSLPNPAITIAFDEVPCTTAFSVVLRSSGWQAETEGGTMQVSSW